MATDQPRFGAGDARREQRDRAADLREASLDVREARVAAIEADLLARVDKVKHVLSDATRRDALADARDTVADDREHAASLVSFIQPTDEYGASNKARRESAINRVESKNDRASSADDRTTLTDG